MLLYPPTQIALAALSYGLQKMGKFWGYFCALGDFFSTHLLVFSGKMKDIFREHILRLCQVDSYRPNVENATMADKLLLRVEQICALVEAQSQPVTQEDKLQSRVGI